MNTIRDPDSGKSWPALRDLIDHIESAYHGYVRLTVPVLSSVTEHIVRERTVSSHAIDHLQRLCTALEDNLESHVARQECRLFPKMRHLREPVGEVAWASRLEDSLDEMMQREERENREAMNLVEQIQKLLLQPAWVERGYHVEELKWDMNELHENLAIHFHLETEVLFPAVRVTNDGRALAV